jgi:hypothetical protein
MEVRTLRQSIGRGNDTADKRFALTVYCGLLPNTENLRVCAVCQDKKEHAIDPGEASLCLLQMLCC